MKILPRLGVALGIADQQVPHAALISLPCVKTATRFAQRASLLRLRDRGFNRVRYGAGDFILHREYTRAIAIVTFSPEMVAGYGVNKLRVDPHAFAVISHAAFHKVANAEFARDQLHIDRAALVGKTGIAGDHEQKAIARKFSDDVVRDAVRKILLLQTGAHVGKRQHRDGWDLG